MRDAGYAPLVLDPIDFNGLYIQQLQASQTQNQAEAGADAPTGNA